MGLYQHAKKSLKEGQIREALAILIAALRLKIALTQRIHKLVPWIKAIPCGCHKYVGQTESKLFVGAVCGRYRLILEDGTPISWVRFDRALAAREKIASLEEELRYTELGDRVAVAEDTEAPYQYINGLLS